MTIQQALKSLFTAEELSGDNAYEHEEQGKQATKKFLRIRKLPPVLQININRFGVSSAGEMMKINSSCEFSDSLDFDKIMESTDSYQLSQPSQSQSGVSNSQQQQNSSVN